MNAYLMKAQTCITLGVIIVQYYIAAHSISISCPDLDVMHERRV